MKCRIAIAIILALGTIGCGSDSVTTPAPQPAAVRTYTGTASVGDFFTVSLDPNAQTLTYTNHSNSDSGTVAYTANADGTYTLSDPNGNLLAAFEVPNYALLIQAAKTGPNHNTLALVTAVQASQISPTTFDSHKYNYMQFRTSVGGVSIGSANIDAQTNITTSEYWPYGAQNQQSPFNSSTFASANLLEDPSGTFMTLTENANQSDYIFGTRNGIFAVDSGSGAILGLQQAATRAFDPTFAATYKTMYFHKGNASTGVGNVESGIPSMGIGSLVVDPAGNVTLLNDQGNVMAQGTLAAVADTPYLFGPNELADPCFGLFTFRLTTANTQQDVFMTFLNQAVLFSSYKSVASVGNNNMYNYFYGVALK